MPYIDLVCELLEETIAPDQGIIYQGFLSDGADNFRGKISTALLTTLQTAGLPVTDQAIIYETETSAQINDLPRYLRDTKLVCKIVYIGNSQFKVYRLRQTLSTAEELAAVPEFVNANAYAALKNNAYAFSLPFDLEHTEAKAYFSRFGISRAQLMKDFQLGGLPQPINIAVEKLGLTHQEGILIQTAEVSNQFNYWNYSSNAVATTEMKVVDTFLNKAQLSYKELELLLTLKFINPNQNIYIKHLDHSCDTTQKEIVGLTPTLLDKVHRFLRLQKKLHWKFETLDEVISQSNLGNGQLNSDCLLHIADLQQIKEITGISLEELIGCYGYIPHNNRKASLYTQIFLNKAKNGFIDEVLLPEQLGAGHTIIDHVASIAVCLQISEKECLSLIRSLVGLDKDLLNLENLSYLFAAAKLMKKLNLKVDEFLLLKGFLNDKILGSPEETLKFISLRKELKQLNINISELQYVLHHTANDLNNRKISEEAIAEILKLLQQNYLKNAATHSSLYNPNLSAAEQTENLSKALSIFPTISPADIDAFIHYFDQEWSSPTDAKNKVNGLLGNYFNTSDIEFAIDTLSLATTAEDILLKGNNLMETLLEAIANYQAIKGQQSILSQVIANTFNTSEELASIIINKALVKQLSPGSTSLQEIFISNNLVSENSLALPITESNFPKEFAAVRLLHKICPLILSLELRDEEVAWFFTNNTALGWFSWDDIPFSQNQTALEIEPFIAFTKAVKLIKNFGEVVDVSNNSQPISFYTLAEKLLLPNTINRFSFLALLAKLTGYDIPAINELDQHYNSPFDLSFYRNIDNWTLITAGASYLRRLGTNVSQIKNYIQAELAQSDIQNLRTALKARYDEKTWMTTLKEITDVIRPQKRDALVGYILATNPDFRTTNDLYDHYLVDVEMEACMPSSRIVQAHGSIQLFVQNCLMGLEQESVANKTKDLGWKQWKWMKNYRVWEANRKVFLYPENWIEGELRDDKSFLFKDLENDLQQEELTAISSEKALKNYLYKLDDIAFLEIAATWYQTDIRTMHVIGRTKGGDPAIYYYRRFVQERYWTPWEKVQLDIPAEGPLLAFVRNNRLSLAWMMISDIPFHVQNENKPQKQIKIQLAISEYVNNNWQPKRVTKEGGIYPVSPIEVSLLPNTAEFNIMYFEHRQEIMIFRQYVEKFLKIAVFKMVGCKGYPEVKPSESGNSMNDFYPNISDAGLFAQKYVEHSAEYKGTPPEVNYDYLEIENAISSHQLLNFTPGQFRLTHPHQYAIVDQVIIFLKQITGFNAVKKTPLGTLLPYFMEDSKHAYVILPAIKKRSVTGGQLEGEGFKTVSQIIPYMESYLDLFSMAQANPNDAGLNNEFQQMTQEMMQILFSPLHQQEFKNMYHPLVCPLKSTLDKFGITQLMSREVQLQQSSFDFNDDYDPNSNIVPKTYMAYQNGSESLSYPVEDLDFTSDGSYSSYNWELFYHVPMLVANRLSQNQKFEDAMNWFHFMFDPTGALEGNSPQKYWVTKPFFLHQESDYINQRIDTLLYNLSDPATNSTVLTDLEFAIEQWRTNPFSPHAIARFRPVAYQKTLLMKYINNLVDWGDYLFRQDTMESIVEATQKYILADKLLGPKPRKITPSVSSPTETYNQMKLKLDAFGNALIDIENILPDLSVLPQAGAELPGPPITLSMLYFCIPENEQMLAYWDRIEDRLFKIRHCQNIDGIERNLALFAPPIDPALLVRAFAAGLDISDVLFSLNSPTPYYRFQVLSQKATEFAQEVRGSEILCFRHWKRKMPKQWLYCVVNWKLKY